MAAGRWPGRCASSCSMNMAAPTISADGAEMGTDRSHKPPLRRALPGRRGFAKPQPDIHYQDGCCDRMRAGRYSTVLAALFLQTGTKHKRAPVAPGLFALKSAVPQIPLDQTEVSRRACELFAKSRYTRRCRCSRKYRHRETLSRAPIEWYPAPHGWIDRTQLYVDNAVDLLETVTTKSACRRKVPEKETSTPSRWRPPPHRHAEPGCAAG